MYASLFAAPFALASIHWKLGVASLHSRGSLAHLSMDCYIADPLPRMFLLICILYISKSSVFLHQMSVSTILYFPHVAALHSCLFISFTVRHSRFMMGYYHKFLERYYCGTEAVSEMVSFACYTGLKGRPKNAENIKIG